MKYSFVSEVDGKERTISLTWEGNEVHVKTSFTTLIHETGDNYHIWDPAIIKAVEEFAKGNLYTARLTLIAAAVKDEEWRRAHAHNS